MPNTQFRIRRATAADSRALAKCRVALFAEIDREPENRAEFEGSCDSAIERFGANGLAASWLAESAMGAAVIGTIMLLTYPRLPAPGTPAMTEGYIVSVYVAPEWRRNGVARALTDAAVAFAREAGMGRVRLHATAGGRAVYEGAGFVAKEDAMELDLAPSPTPT